jgi:hypothetical protein
MIAVSFSHHMPPCSTFSAILAVTQLNILKLSSFHIATAFQTTFAEEQKYLRASSLGIFAHG